MARLNAFHLAPESWREPYVLEGSEARHLLTVLRTQPGETVRLFDGAGREGLFTVRKAGKRSAVLEPVSLTTLPEPASGLYLALGFGKQSRRDMILEKCVELGGAGLFFWQAERSQGKMPGEPKPIWTDKCIQAAKQCGNFRLPEIRMIQGGAAGLAEFGAGFHRRILFWESAPETAVPAPETLAEPGRTLAVFGPEGGLTRDEAELLIKAGFVPANLGHHVLRWETAALLCLGIAYVARQLAAENGRTGKEQA